MQTILSTTSNLNIFEKHLEVAACIIPCLLFGNIAYSNFHWKTPWQRILKNLLKFDHSCRNRKCSQAIRSSGSEWIIIINLLALVLPISKDFMSIKGYSESSLVSIVAIHLSGPIALLYEFNITGFVWQLSCVLQSRYDYLKECMQNVIARRKIVTIHKMDKELQNVIHSYKLLYFCTTDVSVTLGMTIMFCLMHSIVIFLENFYWIILASSLQGQTALILIETVYILIYLVSITFCNN